MPPIQVSKELIIHPHNDNAASKSSLLFLREQALCDSIVGRIALLRDPHFSPLLSREILVDGSLRNANMAQIAEALQAYHKQSPTSFVLGLRATNEGGVTAFYKDAEIASSLSTEISKAVPEHAGSKLSYSIRTIEARGLLFNIGVPELLVSFGPKSPQGEPYHSLDITSELGRAVLVEGIYRVICPIIGIELPNTSTSSQGT